VKFGKNHKVIVDSLSKEEAEVFIEFLVDEFRRHQDEACRLVGVCSIFIKDNSFPFWYSALQRHIKDLKDIIKLIPKVKAKFGIKGGRRMKDIEAVLQWVLDEVLVGNLLSPMAQALGEDYCHGLQTGWNLARATINQEILSGKAQQQMLDNNFEQRIKNLA